VCQRDREAGLLHSGIHKVSPRSFSVSCTNEITTISPLTRLSLASSSINTLSRVRGPGVGVCVMCGGGDMCDVWGWDMCDYCVGVGVCVMCGGGGMCDVWGWGYV
jgi:hypothetical protein